MVAGKEGWMEHPMKSIRSRSSWHGLLALPVTADFLSSATFSCRRRLRLLLFHVFLHTSIFPARQSADRVSPSLTMPQSEPVTPCRKTAHEE